MERAYTKTFLYILCAIAVLKIILHPDCSEADLYASVDELAQWTSSRNKIIKLVDQKLDVYGARLEKLKQLRPMLARALELETSEETNCTNDRTSNFGKTLKFADSQPTHPVGAFIALNKLSNELREVRYLLEGDGTPNEVATDLDELLDQGKLPSEDDAIGSGSALLRLQEFYKLDAKDLAEGRIIHNGRRIDDDSVEFKMDFDDLFALGKIATDIGEYEQGMEWFDMAFSEADHQGLHNSTQIDDINNYNYLLEYMAYAAYKSDRLAYSSQLSQLWAEREPENEKAIANLKYFAHVFDQDAEPESYKPSEDYELDETVDDAISIAIAPNENPEDKDFHVTPEERAQLCRSPPKANRNRCSRMDLLWSPIIGLKIEILHDSPRVIRVYDILTEKEAQSIREAALPALERSTINKRGAFVTSDFRIAKTAWLGNEDPNVERLKTRVSALLGIDLTSSENLQVVNYGLGGFYDLHMDAIPSDPPSDSETTSDQTLLQSLVNDNRLVTVLMYLDEVKAGGATIFPKLSLSAQPIKRSAIIWYNLHKNRTIDTRTQHMACPVLLGSKWIATIWGRELGNTFLHPCGLTRES